MKRLNRFYLLLLITAIVSCTENPERNLGSGYVLTGFGITTEIYKKVSDKEDKEVLLGEIVDYSFNDNFILVHREVSQKVKEHFNDHAYSEIMRGGDATQYWIIQKQKDSVIGPLHKNEYLLKRSELDIPNSVQLEE